MPSEKAHELTWFEEEGKKQHARPAPSKPTEMAETSAANRRRYARFQVADATLTLRKVGLFSALGLGNKGRSVCDLSKTGARLRVTERLTPKEKVKLKIVLEKYQDEIEITGEVRWCHGTKKADEFMVGIQFFTDDEATTRKMTRLHEWFTSHQYKSLQPRR